MGFLSGRKMKVKIKFAGKEVVVEDVKRVSPIGKVTGLMFRSSNTCALLFEFEKGRKAIHSFFCRTFLAVWTLDGKVVDYRFVKPFLPLIKPKSDFDKLIEIPFNSKYTDAINFFTEHGKI